MVIHGDPTADVADLEKVEIVFKDGRVLQVLGPLRPRRGALREDGCRYPIYTT